MSYGVAAALQSGVYSALSADSALAALVGTNIFDAAPTGTVPALYVSLGPEDVTDRSDKDGSGANHDFTVSVVTDAAGFQTAKEVAAAVSDVLTGAALTLTRGTCVGIWFMNAKARRVKDGASRRIDLRFRAYVTDN
ncbi:DUF3168 domain-containing protein [Aliiroseovarius sp. PTFE2010]|uniref:DUF3168 domain-containing protein n=1 Tax=Aliiroseovarius sp. PTFE2010 TaxID=3417190 RepID=UPI003CFB2B90